MLNAPFVHELLTGISDSVYLLSKVHLNVPQRISKHFPLPNINYYRTNYGNNDPVRRLWKQYNGNYNLIDFGGSAAIINSIIKF